MNKLRDQLEDVQKHRQKMIQAYTKVEKVHFRNRIEKQGK
jgi:hypothetical protein